MGFSPPSSLLPQAEKHRGARGGLGGVVVKSGAHGDQWKSPKQGFQLTCRRCLIWFWGTCTNLLLVALGRGVCHDKMTGKKEDELIWKSLLMKLCQTLEISRNELVQIQLSKSLLLDAPLGVVASFGHMNMITKVGVKERKLVTKLFKFDSGQRGFWGILVNQNDFN